MADKLPDYLVRGEVARLFPVLATTSKEGRTTSIVLSCICLIHEFGRELLESIGKRVGTRATIQTFTEISFKGAIDGEQLRPDGLITLKVGSKSWSALVETKVGNNTLEANQLTNYRDLAKKHNIDAVITISNQFTSSPKNHPIQLSGSNRSKVDMFHWSWMHIRTTVELLLANNDVHDSDQLLLLEELKRFLTHESAGVKGFDQMPPQWAEIAAEISTGSVISPRSPKAMTVIDAWQQETRDLSLILSRQTEVSVSEKISRSHLNDPKLRIKDQIDTLCNQQLMTASIEIPDAASPVEIIADIRGRTITASMKLRAPEDRKSTTARLNWLLRQVKSATMNDIHIRLHWPGKNKPTMHSIEKLRVDSSVASAEMEHLQVHSFDILVCKRTGRRFSGARTFIADLEEIIPEFYKEVGQTLSAWKAKAPAIKSTPDHDEQKLPELNRP